jgi:hypothetical protein
MRSQTKKHLSVHEGRARFAQVTVAVLSDERERIREPELFLNDRRIEHPTEEERALVVSAMEAVKKEEDRLGVLMCVAKIDSSYVDAHPEAARLAALAAVAALAAE